MSATGVIPSLREDAAERFAALGWPSPRLEAWKYTNLAPVSRVQWKESPAAAAPAVPQERRYPGAAVELVFWNGHLVAQHGNLPGISNRPADSPNFGQIADYRNHALAALNTMHMRDGVLITIPAGTIVEGFIHLLHLGDDDDVWSHPRYLIEVGSNAQVTIVETYAGRGSYFTNAVTELVVGDGAVVDHYKVESESRSAFHVGTLAIQQSRSSSVTARSISFGGALVRNEVLGVLNGEGASLSLDGLFVLTGSQHVDSHTVIDHAKPHCTSLELYKGILDQTSRGVFDGTIIVRPDAQKTVSRQTNHNLLLSETAIIDSKPTLEIHNDDVKCNHGSTIGQLEEEPLFYLRSRGIGETDARNLLVSAFASELIDRMKIEPVRERIRRELFEQLPQRMPDRSEGSR